MCLNWDLRLLVFHVTRNGISVPTFRDYLSILSSRVKQSWFCFSREISKDPEIMSCLKCWTNIRSEFPKRKYKQVPINMSGNEWYLRLSERLPSAINTARSRVVALKTLVYCAPNDNGHSSQTHFWCVWKHSQPPQDPGERVRQSTIRGDYELTDSGWGHSENLFWTVT
jgi:hypothetical protein